VQIVARENDCFFLNITSDLLRHREYGRTEKVVAAIFSVAAKLWKYQNGDKKRPTIIFLDEVDNVLGGGDSSTHECYLAARSIFAQKWDGIQKTPGMIVMGTTNYPGHLPAFIYRRFLTRTEVFFSFADRLQLVHASVVVLYVPCSVAVVLICKGRICRLPCPPRKAAKEFCADF
jgi:SpoVK/Ycf46/Vps4 family AAA+-type ATPase